MPDSPSMSREPGVSGSHRSDDASSGEAVELLRRIHDQLERSQRRSRQHDFSVLRLFGALMQMLAIVAGFWGLMALTGDRNDAATARLALACLLQIASLAAFVHDHFR
jgi:hypothetical protein